MPRPNPLPAEPRALIERQVAALTELTEIGMEIARAAGRRAVEADETDATNPGLTFARVARAVRLTIALQARLLKQLDGLDGLAELNRTVEAAKRRERIHERVERALEETHDDADEIERLSACVWERLEDEDDAVIADAPVAEVVARIRRDLGLAPDWTGETFAVDPPHWGRATISSMVERAQVARPLGDPPPTLPPRWGKGEGWGCSLQPRRDGA